VIPAYNEEDRIEPTLMNLKRKFQGEQVIVIFDGNDHTPDVCRKYGVEVYVYGKKLGKGGALIEGIKKSRGSIIAFIDADMPVSIDDFKKVIKVAVDNDLVISYRIFENMPAKRLFLHNSFIALTKVIFPELRKFNDLQSGLKVMKADRAKESWGSWS
jgi:Glycosyltransferases, probably involved in cell wall biogenesis